MQLLREFSLLPLQLDELEESLQVVLQTASVPEFPLSLNPHLRGTF